MKYIKQEIRKLFKIIKEKLKNLIKLLSLKNISNKAYSTKDVYKVQIRNIVNKFNSIPIKIILLISIIVIIIMITVNSIVYNIIYSKVYEINKGNMKVVCNEIYENFNNLITIQTNAIQQIGVNNQVVELASLRESYNSRTEFIGNHQNKIDRLGNELKNYSKNFVNDEHIFITDKNGIIIADSNKEFLTYAINGFEFFNECLTKGTAVSEVYISSVTSKPIVTFVESLKDQHGNIIGTVGKSVYTDYFSNRFKDFKFLNTGHIFVLDENQKVIYHPEKYNINKNIGIKEMEYLYKSGNIFDAKNTGELQYIKDNKVFFSSYVTMPQLKSAIFLSVNEKDITNSAETIRMIILVATFIMICLIVIVCFIGITKILKPMRSLANNTNLMAKGDLRIYNKVVNNDEIGDLALSFNKMTDSIKGLLIELKNVVLELTQANYVVKTSQMNMETNMGSLKDNSNTITNDMETINKSIKWCFSSIINIGNKIDDIKLQSENMLLKTEFIKNTNNSSIKKISNLKEVNEKSVEKINIANDSFVNLKQGLSNIKKIINIVNDISRKSNILAFNAAIEASRAGELGKGFNVVAQEIRKLSLNIVGQMNNIEEIIINLDKDMDHTKTSIHEVNEIVILQADAVNETISNFYMVISSTDKIIEHINDLDKSIESLNDENTNIVKELNIVNNSSNDFQLNLEEVNAIMEDQYKETQQMNELINNLDNICEDLNSNLDKFLI